VIAKKSAGKTRRFFRGNLAASRQIRKLRSNLARIDL
jgi:hypothetical protein